jgi:hypothetical protein
MNDEIKNRIRKRLESLKEEYEDRRDKARDHAQHILSTGGYSDWLYYYSTVFSAKAQLEEAERFHTYITSIDEEIEALQ